MKNSIMLPCPICGEPFKKARPWQKVCSPVCRRKKWQIKMFSDMVKQIADNMISDFARKVKAKES
jgi:hypothetical protein